MFIHREIREILCSCGGKPREVERTEAEIATYGCSRDAPDWVCCVMGIECPSCKTRWTLALEAPEME